MVTAATLDGATRRAIADLALTGHDPRVIMANFPVGLMDISRIVAEERRFPRRCDDCGAMGVAPCSCQRG